MNQDERLRRENELAKQYEDNQTTRMVIVAIAWFFALIAPIPHEIRVVIAFVGAFLAFI